MGKKRYRVGLAIITACMLLTGCSTTELEERCFPMIVTVGYDDGRVTYGIGFPKEGEDGQGERSIAKEGSFPEAKKTYEKRLNKDADYNHLKVLALGIDFLEKETVYEEMLENLAQTEAFPRNTYVCVVEEVEDLYEMEKTIANDLGTYMEEYLKKQGEKNDRLLTLGDLMDEKENQEMVLYLPYMEVEENFIEWKGYVNTSGKVWKESFIE